MAIASSVLSAFPGFSKKLEGFTPYLYLDIDGAVTTGIGNLIDSVEAAQRLPWKLNGAPASQAEIASQWRKIKGMKGVIDPKRGVPWQKEGGGAFEPFSTIRLDASDIGTLFSAVMKEHDETLLKSYPAYHSWPADAQLALHSMAWAMGANFAPKYPKFTAAVNKPYPDFLLAAKESYMKDNPQGNILLPPTTNPGLRPRNLANAALFTNAAIALKLNRALSSLSWPTVLDPVTAKNTPWLIGGLGVGLAAAIGYKLTRKG